jgi:hypothetical protein
MSKKIQLKVAQDLQEYLDRSEEFWGSKEVSHAYIVGYLQQTIKNAIEDLKQ